MLIATPGRLLDHFERGKLLLTGVQIMVVDEADRAFVAQALAMLPARPWTVATWGEWTSAVKEATGRKGKDLFRPLRRAVHPVSRPQEPINEVSRQVQLKLAEGSPNGVWVKAVLD